MGPGTGPRETGDRTREKGSRVCDGKREEDHAERRIAIVRVDKSFTVDEVVFAEKGDLLLLGARTLEGLCLTVDSRQKKLVAAGPISAA